MAPRGRQHLETVFTSSLQRVGARLAPTDNTTIASTKSKSLILPSTGAQVLLAILKNSQEGVKFHLLNRANPNVAIGLSHSVRSMDQVFAFKRLFGEHATLVHIAVLNVYHRHTCNNRRPLRRRRELEKAFGILNILLASGGDISTKTTHFFHRTTAETTADSVLQVNIVDLVNGMKRMALCWENNPSYSGGSSEKVMDQCLLLLREYDRPPAGTMKKSKIPYNLVSLPKFNQLQSLLFTEIAKDPSLLIFEDEEAKF